MGSPSTLNPELSSSFLAMLEESSSALLAEELSLILLLDAAWTSSVSDMTHNHFGFQQQGKWGEIILTPQPHLFVLLKNGTLFFFKGRRALSFYVAGGCRALLANLDICEWGCFFSSVWAETSCTHSALGRTLRDWVFFTSKKNIWKRERSVVGGGDGGRRRSRGA